VSWFYYFNCDIFFYFRLTYVETFVMLNVLLNPKDAINFIYVVRLVIVKEKIVVFHIIFMAKKINVLFVKQIVKILINFYSFVLFNCIIDYLILDLR
jgi:hypothetical protein